MKWLATILMLYLSTLLMLPCGDTNSSCSLPDVNPTTTHTHSNKSSDRCSPFCLCSCCNLQISSYHFNHANLGIPVPTILVAEKRIIKNFDFISQYYGNIWQPPKLSC